MRQRKPKHYGPRGRTLAVLTAGAMVAFAVVSIFEIFHIAHSAYERLLNFGAIFRTTVPIAMLLTVVLAGLLLGGLFWFHVHELSDLWRKFSKHLNLPLRNLVTASCFVTALAIALNTQISSETKLAPKKAVAETSVDERPSALQDDSIGESPSAEHSPLPAPPSPLPRMANRHVCDLYEDPTDSEWNACEIYNRKNPNLKGKGGPVCIMVHGKITCLRDFLPLPRPRPPLDIRPNLN